MKIFLKYDSPEYVSQDCRKVKLKQVSDNEIFDGNLSGQTGAYRGSLLK